MGIALLLYTNFIYFAVFCVLGENKKIPISLWKSGFYRLLFFFKVVPPGIDVSL